jgi:YhcH/YjgK/YiaL family protein
MARIKQQFLFISIVLCSITSCHSSSSDNPENWGPEELAGWFRSSEWKSGWKVPPDKSVNAKELACQVFKNKKRWGKAFLFLKTNDLKNLKPGKYELEGDSLFVNVSVYPTKNEEDVNFEAHRKYADIQYVVSGKERIGVVPLSKAEVIVPYDDAKDAAFLKAEKNNFRIANPERFFVFFPDDAHRPSIKVDDNELVNKIVIKVKL